MNHNTEEKTPLKVLYLEDSPKDIEIIRELLIESGFDFTLNCAKTKEEYISLLNNQRYDIILSDFTLPGFNALSALQIHKDICPEIPFICISGSIGEETAIELIKQGAVDYVLKDRMVRLPVAIQRALDEAKEKDSLRRAEARFRSYFELPVAGIAITSPNEKWIEVNNHLCSMLGYSREELLETTWSKLTHPDDLNKDIEQFNRVIKGEIESYSLDKRFIRKDGVIIWISLSVRCVRLEDKKVDYFISLYFDITDRKRIEDSIRESEEKYRSIYENSSVGILLTVPNGSILSANDHACTLFGMTEKEFRNKRREDIVDVTDPRLPKLLEERKITGKAKGELTFIRKDGTKFEGEVFSVIFKDKNGKEHSSMIIKDITERKQAQDAITKREYQLNEAQRIGQIGSWEWDAANRITTCSDELFRIFDRDRESFKFSLEDFLSLPHPDDSAMVNRIVQKVIEKPQPVDFEFRIIWSNGEIHWIFCKSSASVDETGKLKSVFGTAQDITERKQAERALKESEEKYRSIFENIQDIYYETSLDGTILEVSPSIKILSEGQYEREDLIGKSIYDFYADVEKRKDLLKQLHEKDSISDYEITLINRNEVLVPCSISSKICYDANGQPQKIIGSIRDITTRKQAEEALRETRDYFDSLLSFANAPILVWNVDYKITRFNMACERLTGYTMYECNGQQLDMLFPLKTKESSLALIAQTSEGDHLVTVDIPILCKDGSIRNVIWNTANIYTADGQTLISTIAQGQDITEQKKLQNQFLQAQKSESVGTLAGGIAHDFNNILGIILSYNSIIKKSAADKEKVIQYSDVIAQAVNRGALLVRQILTFARKSEVNLMPLNLADLIQDIISMLRQTFSKLITFTEIVDNNLPFIDGDRTQIHQLLMNLCVNARDAMPKGGSITIEAKVEKKLKVQERIPKADQDSYICLSVIDTGEGMTEAIRRQIFDPFFTTKELGKGTGLGLAVVYGVVKSHHGFIDVESEVGKGTTFRLYFPVPQESVQVADITQSAESFDIGGTETILLIEDEEVLIEIVRFMLESKGYKVFTAQDGKDAIMMYEQHKNEIDIVLSDLGLPGIAGCDMLKKMKEISPKIPVIFASGFFEPDLKSKLYNAGVKAFIQKPYSPDEVLRKLRETLDKN